MSSVPEGKLQLYSWAELEVEVKHTSAYSYQYILNGESLLLGNVFIVLEISKEILEKFKIFYENLQWTVGLRRVFQSAAGMSLKAVSICLGAPAPLANVNTILHKDSLIASSSSIGHLVTMICLWAWQWELPCCADCFSLSTEHAKYLQPWSSNAFWNMN